MTRDEIFAKIKDVLTDALGVDDDEVTGSARLQADLGAESIDYLDISFKLEQAFGIKIGQGELFPDGSAQNAGFVKDGRITPDGIDLLKKKLPHVDFAAWEKDPQISKVANLFTVDALVNFVQRKLAA
ncbi:MAG: acyl carrier protein [Planctomycetes bacterium]|nr:acyl carrier protein [Planctomycetota bacterium]